MSSEDTGAARALPDWALPADAPCPDPDGDGEHCTCWTEAGGTCCYCEKYPATDPTQPGMEAVAQRMRDSRTCEPPNHYMYSPPGSCMCGEIRMDPA